jgi:hypothetical protein
MWSGFVWFSKDFVPTSCDNDNEPPGPVKIGDFLKQSIDY